ncbi:hypothetical protein BU16DRAFT_396410 [Lophium mytilinum]|uniref:Uncharacterized protein n=1 Tax=Lophium mytilinum TaxID=390894 RepID=A0A6A6QU05_9PEZI|nr:hypothetical protein BU16DRAFT_396410 [Lophium mytilinum]
MQQKTSHRIPFKNSLSPSHLPMKSSERETFKLYRTANVDADIHIMVQEATGSGVSKVLSGIV